MYTLAFGTYIFPNQTFELKGLGLVFELDQAQVPRRAGSRVAARSTRAREIRIDGKIHGDTEQAVYQDLSNMAKALDQGLQNFQYRDTRILECWTQRIAHAFIEGANPCVADVRLDLIAPFPYPRGVPHYGTSVTMLTTFQTVDISYGGNAPSFPVLSLAAIGLTVNGASTVLRVQNLTTGEVFRYLGTLAPGASVTVDCRENTVRKSGADDINNFDGQFPQLAGGSNVFSVEGATLRFDLSWHERFYA
jgi:phage-related protein